MSKDNEPLADRLNRAQELPPSETLEHRAIIDSRKHNAFLEHNCKYKNPKNQGCIGGVLTYSYTDTTVGTVVKVECACGQKEDITHYDSF